MWCLTGTTACWESGRFQARVDVARPELGITHVAWDRQALTDAALMQMYLHGSTRRCSIQLEDCYIRGVDLIARYADVSRQIVFPEFCWRMCDQATEPDAVVIESLFSVHTQLLDSDPEVTVQCQLPADRYQVWRDPADATFPHPAAQRGSRTSLDITASGCVVVWQSTGQPLVFGQLVHPADVSHAEVGCDATGRFITSRIDYFQGRLEKGVIRRARLRGVLTRGDRALRVLTDQWHDLLLAPPPLST